MSKIEERDGVADTAFASHGRGSQLVELASGVDMLVLSGRAIVPKSVLDRLEYCRTVAQDQGAPCSIRILDAEFGVAGQAWGKYRFRLEHPDGLVGITESSSLPAVRVQIRSAFLHGAGAENALDWFTSRLTEFIGPIRWNVSRVDLHADLHGWDLQPEDRDAFVCRATDWVTYGTGGDWTGFGFGSRSTNTISARIYDKTVEIAKKGGYLWPLVWGDAFDPDRRVVRVEFEFGRQALREYGIESPWEALASAGGLWASVTRDWLTHRTPTGDGTRSRWPFSEYWQSVQRARLAGGAVGIERVTAAAKRAAYRTIIQGLGGYLVSLGAFWKVTEPADVLAYVGQAIEDWERHSHESFPERVLLRMLQWEFR